jgi:hypothetical protein
MSCQSNFVFVDPKLGAATAQFTTIFFGCQWRAFFDCVKGTIFGECTIAPTLLAFGRSMYISKYYCTKVWTFGQGKVSMLGVQPSSIPEIRPHVSLEL